MFMAYQLEVMVLNTKSTPIEKANKMVNKNKKNEVIAFNNGCEDYAITRKTVFGEITLTKIIVPLCRI